MDEFENPIERSDTTEGAPGQPKDAVPRGIDRPAAAAAKRACKHWTEFARENWKEMAALSAAVAGATILATLAATHNTAVAENAYAYGNGLRDGLDANMRTYLTGYGECLDDHDVDD